MANSLNLSRRAALAGAATALAAGPASARTPKVGEPAPAFTVVTFNREKVTSEQLRGRVVVLNFWATWCAPCRGEMLVMDAYMRRHAGTDLAIFAVSTEDSVPDSQLRPLAKVLAFPLATHISGRGYGVIDNGVPTSFVIDRTGMIRYAANGAFDAESFAELITPLLAEPIPPALPVAPQTPTI